MYILNKGFSMYRRRYTPRRSYRGRRRYNSRRSYTPSYGQIGRKLWNDVKKLKGLINVEFKSHDVNASTDVNTSGIRVGLTELQKGDDSTNRDGRQVRWKSIQATLKYNWDTSATAATKLMNAIVIDTSPNGTLPTIADIYTDFSMGIRNLAYRKRFIVLKSWITLVNSDYPEKMKRIYKKIDMKTVYNSGNAGTIADIESNAIFFLCQSDEPTAGLEPRLDYYFRLRFIDN